MSMHRWRSVATALLVVVLVLTGQEIWQQRRLRQLELDLSYQQRHALEQAGRLAAEQLRGRRPEMVQAIQWLHDYYGSDEGLRRPGGLWRVDQKQVDAEAIGAWVFDVYLNARLAGKSEDEARQMVKDAIRASDEWRAAHAAK